jgi:hypothetical protein
MKRYAFVVFWSDEDAAWVADAPGPAVLLGLRQHSRGGDGGAAHRGRGLARDGAGARSLPPGTGPLVVGTRKGPALRRGPSSDLKRGLTYCFGAVAGAVVAGAAGAVAAGAVVRAGALEASVML